MGKYGTGKVAKKCNFCAIDFLARHDRLGLFCSKICAAKGSNKRKRNFDFFRCKTCDKDCKRRKGAGGTKEFCSIKCMATHRGKIFSRENHPKWKGGISERPHKAKKAICTAKKIKKECERCGCKNNLHGHHKVKYSENPELCDRLDNIEIICSQCHSKEHPEYEGMLSVPPIRKGMNVKCVMCEQQYYVPRYKIKTTKCCSRKCAWKRLREINNGQRKMDSGAAYEEKCSP